jgi:dihydroorotase
MQTEPRFDLLISGGTVIDPGGGHEGRLDVAITADRIAAVERDIPRTAARRVIDATGKYVTPGLVDLHTHCYWGATYWGIEADPVAASTGVTTWLDVGSSGGYNFPAFRRFLIEPSQVRIYALLNISCIGLTAPTYELSNPDYLDVELAAGIAEANRDIIRGIKARIDRNTTRGVGIEGLRRAREAADRLGAPLMVHIGSGPPPLEAIFSLLKPGDILTHCFTGGNHRIINPDGKVKDFVKRLWDQGLILDIGHGTGSFSFEVAEAMLAQGLLPDVISTDIHQMSIQGPMFDMPTTLSKFLNLGMSLTEVIERATVRPARAIGLTDLGTLTPGKPADVAVFELQEGEFTFYDVFVQPRRGTKRLVNVVTICRGKVLERVPPRPLQPWAALPKHQKQFQQPGPWLERIR